MSASPHDVDADLRARLIEAESALDALRRGDADALVGPTGVIGLAGAERPYQMFFEAMNEGGLTLDADGHILHCNPRLATMLGVPLERLRGQALNAHLQPADHARVDTLLAQTTPGSCEAALRVNDGSVLPVRLSVRPMTVAGQRLLCVVVTDLSERLATEHGLRQREEKMRSILRATPVGIGMAVNRVIAEVNCRLCDMLGYTAAELIGQSSRMLYPSDAEFAAVGREKFRQFAAHGSGLVETRFRRKDGRILDIALSSAPLDAADLTRGVTFAALDVTEQRRVETVLRRAAIVFDNSQDGILVSDANNVILDVNPGFCRITGYARAEVIGRDPSLLRSGLHDQPFYRRIWEALAQQGAWRGEVWNRRKNGEVYSELLSINVSRNETSGAIEHYVGVFTDLSQLKAHAAELDRAAHYDPLTGIPNRRLLSDRLELALAVARRSARTLAICHLDLDSFKAVNDQYGHAAGDRLLIAVTQQLAATLREGDTLARLGGDDFILLFTDLQHEQDYLQALDRVLGAVMTPVCVDHVTHTVTASIGVTLFPRDNADADTLLRHADQAMFRAKEAGKNRFHVFDPEYDRQVQAHREALQRMAVALARDEFVLHYQPKVNLLSGAVVGAEALIRWQHPERGLLAPGEFLHYLPGSELEIAIGEWVIEATLQQIAAWNAQGLRLVLSANVSPDHLQRPDFAARLAVMLSRHPAVPGAQLELEIVESAAIGDLEHATRTLSACLSQGVCFALDDFGTGYSSLTYCRKLPVQTLKIDQAFVRDMLDDPEDMGIVDSVVRLGHVFNRPVIAEGVETLAHGAMLVSLGCALAQGYGISRPMPAAEMIDWVARWGQDSPWHHLVDAVSTAA